MHTTSIEAVVRHLATPLVSALGLEVWGVESESAGRQVVRLYIDSVTISQCEEISRQLGLALDVEDVFSGAYVLEVSSPGLSRRFFDLSQMSVYIGEIVKVSLHTAIAPENSAVPLAHRKSWQGILEAVSESRFVIAPVTISDEGEIIPEPIPKIAIEWTGVKKARLVHVFKKPPRPGKKSSLTVNKRYLGEPVN